MAAPSRNNLRDSILPAVLLAGDAIVAFSGLSLAYWLRYHSTISALGIDVPGATYELYRPLLLVGVLFLIGAFAQRGLYDGRVLLRKQHALNLLTRATVYWVIVYLAFSLVVKFDPPISRLFVLLAGVLTLLLLWIWREIFYRIITRRALLPKLQRRVALLGWSDSAQSLVDDVARGGCHPYQVVGCIDAQDTPEAVPLLGGLKDLKTVLEDQRIDVLLAAKLEYSHDTLNQVTESCEQTYTEWKVLPAAFPIFLSGLRLQTVGSVPVIGIEDLAIARLISRGAKRVIDVIGALLGLVAAAPFVGLLAILIKRESPGGPVLFRQPRIGTNHRPFTLLKLRSMTPDADLSDEANQSTQTKDPRLLRIGALMRRWNLDELPQYWNVLRGEMSLVGPRPERPHHVDALSSRIPHYLPRHTVKPGMTGWAQINGLRGDTDLAERIRFDIYYIENWSIWFDIQIMLLTFTRWKSGAK